MKQRKGFTIEAGGGLSWGRYILVHTLRQKPLHIYTDGRWKECDKGLSYIVHSKRFKTINRKK